MILPHVFLLVEKVAFLLTTESRLSLDVNLERSAKHDYEECCGSGSSRICIILPDPDRHRHPAQAHPDPDRTQSTTLTRRLAP
jgi:hypothetical protein